VTHIVVQVLDGSRLLEERRCRQVTMPDGRLGAVWRGQAYPLLGEGRIDVSGPAALLAECRPPETMPPASRATGFAVVEGDEDAWLLVAGSVAARDEAAARLRQVGLSVLRSGPWLGDPVDGLVADWFVRFLRPKDGAPLPDLGLGLPLAAATPRDPAQEAIRLLEAELAAVRGRLAAADAAASEAAARPPSRDADIQVLREALAAEQALRQAADAAASEANAALIRAATEARPSVSGPRMPPIPAPRRVEAEVTTILAALLPRIALIRDSLTVACGEYADRQPLYRALAELQAANPRLPNAWKKLKGVDAWWERHVSDGASDAGRIYVRQQQADLTWQVLLSHKGQQERDIAWLKRQ
jgi:hypothetical protein